VEQMKQAIVLEWYTLSQRFIDDSIDQWRRRRWCVLVWSRNSLFHCTCTVKNRITRAVSTPELTHHCNGAVKKMLLC